MLELNSFNRAKLDGCILGRGTKVGAKAELKQCVTQAGYEVDAGGESLYASRSHESVNVLILLDSYRFVQE